MQEATIWGIHAGRTGDAESLFMKQNVIAIGWSNMGNLAAIAPNREAFKAVISDTHPDMKDGAVPGSAGQTFRFVHEMQVGDLVVYPSKITKLVNIGRVEGSYQYDPDGSPGYPNQRRVTWLKSVPRLNFSQGALYEIGSALSLFQIKNYAEEYRAALEGATVVVGGGEPETVGLIAEEIEQTTRDFILKTLSQELKGHPFAAFVAHLLNAMGYRTRVSPPGPDTGIDIVAHRDELGFEPPIIKVQVKSSAGNIGNPEVASLYGNIAVNEHGLFVTLGSFTNQAKTFGKGKSNLRLIDGDELVDLILTHYDQFDSRYKGLLPLKQVYIPESFKEE